MSEAASHAARMEALRLIRDSAGAVLAGDLRRIRALRFTPLGFDPAVLRRMGELGWIALRLPEALGGSGLGMAEACALAEELGAGLVPEPLIPAQLSAALLAAAGEMALLERLLAGECYIATAWQEAPDAIAAPGGAGPRLFVPAARAAAFFLMPRREGTALALELLPAGAQTLEVRPLQDGGHAARFEPLLAGGRRIAASVEPALDAALEEAALATAAMLLGIAGRAHALTLAHLRTRRQFGRPIGSFQALQHRAVDQRVMLALTRASLEAAAAAWDADANPAARRAAVSRAKARASETALRITREAVQMHGAIGYTDEGDIGLYLRRAMVLANAFGSAALHRRRFLALAGEEEAG